MKRAVILHGTGGNPQANWFPWLKKVLEKDGYEVWVPELPNNQAPNRQVYNDFLLNGTWDFTDNLVVGHSSGAVSVLNLLEDDRCPRIKAGVLVGAWARMRGTELDPKQFNDLFPPTGFDFAKIQSKTGELMYLHGDDDPYCPLDQTQWLAKQTNSEITIVPHAGHFSASLDPQWTELPQLLEILAKHQLIEELDAQT